MSIDVDVYHYVHGPGGCHDIDEAEITAFRADPIAWWANVYGVDVDIMKRWLAVNVDGPCGRCTGETKKRARCKNPLGANWWTRSIQSVRWGIDDRCHQHLENCA